MNLADEMRQSGVLSEAEFEAAKARVLTGAAVPPPVPPPAPPPVPVPAAVPQAAYSMPQAAYAPPQAAVSPPPVDQDAATRQWAMFLHLSQLAGYIIPLAGMVVPIILWQIKKKDLPGIDEHGCHAVNWIITELIAMIICVILIFVVIGIPMLIVVAILGVIFPIIAAVKAYNGEVWKYPMTFTFFRPSAPVDNKGW
jgi:uncharacterized protein